MKTKIRTELVKFLTTEQATVCTSVFSIPVLPYFGYMLKPEKYTNEHVSVCFQEGRAFVYATGLATLKTSDENDKQVARRIAETKSQRTGFKIIRQIYMDYMDLVGDFEGDLSMNLLNTEASIMSIEKHLAKLTNSNDAETENQD